VEYNLIIFKRMQKRTLIIGAGGQNRILLIEFLKQRIIDLFLFLGIN